MKAKVIETGEIIEVKSLYSPIYSRLDCNGKIVSEYYEDELEFIYPNKKEENFDLEKALSDLDREIKDFVTTDEFEKDSAIAGHYWAIAKHAFLFGLKAYKGE